jgi:hypothetical protein
MKGALLSSFFLAGFESSTGYNVNGEWIDQVVATQHDVLLDEDYRRLKDIGIRAAREGIRWPLVDINGRYDFSTIRPLLEASRRHGIEIIYDLFHFGFPSDIDLLSSEFSSRFSDYCHAVARFISESTEGTCYFTPINEPSYFSWAAGEAGLFAPHLRGRGFELKVNLVTAAITAINAIWDACPRARIVNVDSLCRVVPSLGMDDQTTEVDDFNSCAVFQSWDMLSGKLYPELGGSPLHLDTIGVNYYWTNQWEAGRPGVPLSSGDPRRWSLRRLLQGVWQRYGADLIITETGHVDEMRAVWFRDLSGEIDAMLEDQLPLRGVCLYPILGMPEWHDREQWTRMGLWDLVLDGPNLKRIPYLPLLEALTETQRRFQSVKELRRSVRWARA